MRPPRARGRTFPPAPEPPVPASIHMPIEPINSALAPRMRPPRARGRTFPPAPEPPVPASIHMPIEPINSAPAPRSHASEALAAFRPSKTENVCLFPKKNADAAVKWMTDPESDSKTLSLLMIGPTGCGKSALIEAFLASHPSFAMERARENSPADALSDCSENLSNRRRRTVPGWTFVVLKRVEDMGDAEHIIDTLGKMYAVTHIDKQRIGSIMTCSTPEGAFAKRMRDGALNKYVKVLSFSGKPSHQDYESYIKKAFFSRLDRFGISGLAKASIKRDVSSMYAQNMPLNFAAAFAHAHDCTSGANVGTVRTPLDVVKHVRRRNGEYRDPSVMFGSVDADTAICWLAENTASPSALETLSLWDTQRWDAPIPALNEAAAIATQIHYRPTGMFDLQFPHKMRVYPRAKKERANTIAEFRATPFERTVMCDPEAALGVNIDLRNSVAHTDQPTYTADMSGFRSDIVMGTAFEPVLYDVDGRSRAKAAKAVRDKISQVEQQIAIIKKAEADLWNDVREQGFEKEIALFIAWLDKKREEGYVPIRTEWILHTVVDREIVAGSVDLVMVCVRTGNLLVVDYKRTTIKPNFDKAFPEGKTLFPPLNSELDTKRSAWKLQANIYAYMLKKLGHGIEEEKKRDEKGKDFVKHGRRMLVIHPDMEEAVEVEHLAIHPKIIEAALQAAVAKKKLEMAS